MNGNSGGAPGAGAEPSIEIRNVVQKFRDHQALNGISFTVPKEVRCVGFLGPNGSGKTTTIRILTGLLRPTEGEVQVAGIDVVSEPDRVRERIGCVEQHPALIPWMTGLEFLELAGRLYRLPSKEARARAKELLARVGLEEAGRRRIGGYSGGMKKRLGIAQALIGRPQVVFLDEPVAEMDPIGRVEVLALLEELKRETTVFMSSHLLEDIERVADRIIIMNKGEIRRISTLEDLRTEYAVRQLRLSVESGLGKLFEDVRNRMGHLVEVVTQNGKELRIVPTDRDRFAGLLQHHLVEERYVLTHYEWVEPTLEEIFMRVVNEG